MQKDNVTRSACPAYGPHIALEKHVNLVEYPHLSEGLNGVSTANDKNNGHLRLTIHFLPM